MASHPHRLGKYDLQECLGRGGMAEVWKAFDTQLKRFVAVKILRADLQADPSVVGRFEREAQVIASLHHPNIVQVYDFNVARPPEVDSTVLYMVMNYVEGPTLASFIRSTSRAGHFPSPAAIVQLFTPISLAIDHAHQKGMIHRDIKPSNILLDEHNTSHNAMGEPILSDFGIAKMLGGAVGTGTGWWLGTPTYMAPEQVMGAPGNERSDIYALGVILYEMCTGVLPFQGGTPTEIMMQHINVPPPAPMLINPAIPPALTGVMLRALAKDPAARFPTASAMVVALAESFNMPVPKALNTASGVLEAGYSATHLHPLSPQIMSGKQSAVSLPTIHPVQPVPSPSLPGASVAANSGQGMARNPYITPNIASLSQSSGTLPAVTSLQPSGGLASLSLAPSTPVKKRGRRWLLIGLISALIFLLLVSGLGTYFLLFNKSTGIPHTSIVGHAVFISSGQIGEASNQGITDELQIDLSNVPDPAPGKSYYGWLEPDINQTMRPPILLGRLPVTSGKIVYLYHGDAQHTNLLATMSRFLITEEDATAQPNIPTPDNKSWRYVAQFPQPTGSMNSTQNTTGSMSNMENLTVLDHLRHLLSEAPELQAIGLSGGLDIWLFRNTEKVLEWSVSGRDDWQTRSYDSLHRQVLRILDYLDGISLVKQDAPGQAIYVTIPNGKIGLLDVDPHMTTHGFLYTIDVHLNAMIQSPNSTPEQRQLATKIDNAVKNMETWLSNVRKDAQQLAVMSSAQLAQPAVRDSLLDTMSNDALAAFAGRIDPGTGNVQEGMIQLHYDIQHLATFDVQPYIS